MTSHSRLLLSLSGLLLAPGAAAQLILPADGQPAFDGSTTSGGASLATDVNADGYPDLVFTGFGVSVGLNNGHGIFRSAGPGPTTELVYEIASGDLDGDGNVDLVTASQSGSGSITTLAGDGAGRFTLTQAQPVSEPVTLALADFDLDGRLDVVAGHALVDFSIQTLAGLGDGTLAAPVPYGNFGSYGSIDAADWNLDGRPDVAGTNSTTFRLFLGNAAGSFDNGPSQTSYAGGQLHFVDYDGDGWTDAVNTNSSGGDPGLVFRHNSAGLPAPAFKSSLDAASDFAVERDPSDGFPDLVVAGSETLERLANITGAGFGQTGWIHVEHGIDSLAIADFDGDGDADVMVSGAATTVYFQAADGHLAKPKHFALPAAAQYVGVMVLAHLNGDARPDLVVADRDASMLYVAKGKSSGLSGGVPFGPWAGQSTTYSSIDIASVDVNGDGDDDVLLLGATSQALTAHLGDGTTALGAPLLTPLGLSPIAFAMGDLDADGSPDAAVIESAGATTPLVIWLGTGTGQFTQAGQIAIGSGGHGVALGDVDGDGFLDAIGTHSGGPLGGEALVCHGDGSGSFGPPVLASPTIGVSGDVLVADFDADGRQDLAASGVPGGSVALFLNDGAGGFDPPAVGGLPSVDENSLIAADVDGDGALDLVHGSFFEAAAYVVRGDGHGGLLSPMAHPGSKGGGWRTVAAADLNLDGMTDLLQLGTQGDDLTLFLRHTGADNPWASIGGGIVGAGGQPRAVGAGEPVAGQLVNLDVDHAAPNVPALVVIGLSLLDTGFKGGRLVPSPDFIVPVQPADATGELHLLDAWPAGIPSGTEVWLQVFFVDSSATHGVSATGGLRLRVP